ncbi:MAG: MarR family transcriptional regulator [Reyranella sp.]|nr:MarR family transcriptional regulator [Reyranella sp.]
MKFIGKRARICLMPKQSPFTTRVMGRPPAKSPAAKPVPRLDRGVLPTLLGYALRRAQSAVFADFSATFSAAGEALTPGEFGLLVLVGRNAGLSQTALARALGIDRSTLVPILDRLQARGLLVRRRSPSDGRMHALALTSSGGEALARFTGLVKTHERRIGSRLSAAETRTLIGLLEKVRLGARSL